MCVCGLTCIPVPCARAQVFNTRKMSPVFTSPVENEAPPVFVDRLGAKAWTSHTGREGVLGVVLAKLQTLDLSHVCVCMCYHDLSQFIVVLHILHTQPSSHTF